MVVRNNRLCLVMITDFVRPAFSVCIRFGVRNSFCELRSPKFELSGDRPLEADDNSRKYAMENIMILNGLCSFVVFIVKYSIFKWSVCTYFWCMKHFSENQFLIDVSGICQFFQQTYDIDLLVNNWSSLFSFLIEKIE